MAEATWHSSRHFLGLQARAARWLPCAAPPPPDHSGRTVADKLCVLGGWHEDTEKHYLWVTDMRVGLLGDGGAQVEEAEASVQAAWQHSGRITDMQVARLSAFGEVLVMLSSSAGGLSFLKIFTPREQGAPLSDVEVRGGTAEDDEGLAEWLPALHSGPVASIDMCERAQVLSAGMDGRIFVLPAGPDTPAGAEVAPFHDNAGTASFLTARWWSGAKQTFVTASTSGGLSCWDARARPKPTITSPSEWLPTVWTALEVHPARPLCATGGAHGEVAIWDLRLTSRPIANTPGSDEERTHVWEIHFDVSEPLMDSGLPPLLFCNEAGMLVQAKTGTDGSLRCETLYAESSAINSFDIEMTTGRDILWATDQECAGYLRRPAPF
mmetsp:Transcript_17580/g.45005  ORF Transcript_17580/g.45005 Transcript_17580/m.45005 type:complete len:381 (+) Transcript_17580:307-1449(+)